MHIFSILCQMHDKRYNKNTPWNENFLQESGSKVKEGALYRFSPWIGIAGTHLEYQPDTSCGNYLRGIKSPSRRGFLILRVKVRGLAL